MPCKTRPPGLAVSTGFAKQSAIPAQRRRLLLSVASGAGLLAMAPQALAATVSDWWADNRQVALGRADTARSSRLAPDFLLPVFGQPTVQRQLSEMRGQWVYLDFWASWCIPCRLSFPFMNELHRSLGPKGLTVLAVGLDKQLQRMSDFLSANPADFGVVWDPSGQTASRYQVTAMPTSFVIAPNGSIVEEHKGFHQGAAASIAQGLRRYLEGPSPS